MSRLCLLVLVALAGCDTVGEDRPPVADAPAWDAMLDAVNGVRAQGARCGGDAMPPVGPLVWDARLERAAEVHARDMAEHRHLEHRGTDGLGTGDRVRRAGYDWRVLGENLARHQVSVEQVVGDWMASPGHCRLMMDPTMLELGAAEAGGYWTQVFGVERD